MSDKEIIADYTSSAEVLLSTRKKLINMPSAEDLDSSERLATKRTDEILNKQEEIKTADAVPQITKTAMSKEQSHQYRTLGILQDRKDASLIHLGDNV